MARQTRLPWEKMALTLGIVGSSGISLKAQRATISSLYFAWRPWMLRRLNCMWWHLWPRGRRWAEGHMTYTGFIPCYHPTLPRVASPTLLMLGPFRSFLCCEPTSGRGSCADGDGAVRFVTSSIEAGNPAFGSISSTATGASSTTAYGAAGRGSPYGLWGSLGSRAAKEVLNGDF